MIPQLIALPTKLTRLGLVFIQPIFHFFEKRQELVLVGLGNVVLEVTARYAVPHRVDVGLEVVLLLLQLANLAVLHEHLILLVFEGINRRRHELEGRLIQHL